MKIKNLQLKNFKRFTDLALQDIPEDAKLVLLIGSNGSGKSSVFDAFEYLATQNGKGYVNTHGIDFRKDSINNVEVSLETYEYGKEGLQNNHWTRTNMLVPERFYGRTSFRQIPRLTRNQLGNSFNVSSDTDRPPSFIERDERFENDLEHIFGKLLKEFFRTKDDKSEIKEKVIMPINAALDRIFNRENGTKIQLTEIIPPLEGKTAQINFKKGTALFHYNYLSAGEKEVFNILINLVARGEYYKDTIYFFDEIDLHLNTKLQYNFIKEIVENWIPKNCQFWTASHSLGFIQYSKEIDHSVIFDFDDFDFDFAKILTPEPKDNPNIYQIAVDKDFLPSLFQGLEIVFVENKDKTYYGCAEIDKTVFVPENGRNGVYHKIKNREYKGIVDRDFLTDEDIEAIIKNYKTLKIINYYSIENYLYHPDNLEEYNITLGKQFDKDAYVTAISAEKNKIKGELIPGLSLKRTEYPYFGEPDFNGKPDQNRFKNKQENFNESAKLSGYLESDDFETFYKILPMKMYATQLEERKNISKTELAKTKWFKNQIVNLLK